MVMNKVMVNRSGKTWISYQIELYVGNGQDDGKYKWQNMNFHIK